MFHPPPPPPPPPEPPMNNAAGQAGSNANQGQQQQQPASTGSQPQSSSQAPSIISAFPDPPSQFVNLFSDDNLAKGFSPDPPKPIAEGNYSMFGTVITCDDSIIRPLEAQGIRRLYPRDFDHKKELKKMNHSILVNFLDLLDIMVKCPETPKREEKCSDINMLFIQMHHLINELRPHQARETVRVTLQYQRRERLLTAVRMNQQIEKVTETIANHLTLIPDSLFELKANIEEDVERLRQLCLSEELEEVPDEGSINEMVELDCIMCNLVSAV